MAVLLRLLLLAVVLLAVLAVLAVLLPRPVLPAARWQELH